MAIKRPFLVSGFFLILPIFLGPVSAYAIKGNYISEDLLPKQSCLLKIMYGSKKKLIGVCSATIVSPDQLLTADHCVDQGGFMDHRIKDSDYSYQVECPGHKPFTAIVQSRSKSTREDKGPDQTARSDKAVLKILGQFKTTPAKMVYSAKNLDDLLLMNQCYVFGYGYDNDQKLGVHHGVHLKPMTLEQSVSKFGKLAKDWLMFEDQNQMDHGDSGGGTYCKDKNGQWVLIGVNSFRIEEQDDHDIKKGKFSGVSLINQDFGSLDKIISTSRSSYFLVINHVNLVCQTQNCIDNYGPYSFGDHTQNVLKVLKKIESQFLKVAVARRKAALYDQDKNQAIKLAHQLDQITLDLYQLAVLCGKIKEGSPFPKIYLKNQY